MSTPSTQTTDRTDHGRDEESGARSLASELVATARNRDRAGSTAVVAGGTLLARAVSTLRRNRRRAAIQGLIGGALVAFGLRRSRAARGDSRSTVGGDASLIDTARSAAESAGVGGSDDVNPRGVSNEPDVETETDPDEGAVQFTTDQDDGPRSKPHLDGTDDPRRHEEEGEVDVDVSEASLADEASEATGPDPEQAQPASTEGTEPESTPDEDVSHVEADEPTETDAGAADDESADDGSADEGSTDGSTDEGSADGSALADEALDESGTVDAVSDPDDEAESDES